MRTPWFGSWRIGLALAAAPMWRFFRTGGVELLRPMYRIVDMLAQIRARFAIKKISWHSLAT
jgi:hypothetical protein